MIRTNIAKYALTPGRVTVALKYPERSRVVYLSLKDASGTKLEVALNSEDVARVSATLEAIRRHMPITHTD